MENETDKEEQFFIKIVANKVKDYQWGSKNPQCYVAKFANQKSQKYAELWIGCHKKGCSMVSSTQSLIQYLQSTKQSKLQFLFKVLSIQKCLSIQVHPNRQQAKNLHHKNPEVFGDINEKPEMFLTLTPFKCFLGFRNSEDLQKLLTTKSFSVWKNLSNLLILRKILQMSQNQITYLVQQILQQEEEILRMRRQLLISLKQQFGIDVGLVISCFLQYHYFSSGISFGIPAGVPHAYISGQCLELMKNSDNVVRAGLTNKLKQADLLMQIIENNYSNYPQKIFKIESYYKWREFKIYQFVSKQSRVTIQTAALGIVTSGTFYQINKHTSLIEGQTFYIGKGQWFFSGQGRMFIATNII